MKIVSISDTHIIKEGDQGDEILNLFFENRIVQNAETIVLVGDIFDYAAGFHLEYFVRFKRFFTSFGRALRQGQRIVFIEGNHDIHIKKNFLRYIQDNNLDSSLFEYIPNSYEVIDDEKSILFSHGDEAPGANEEYLKYKSIIRSRPLSLLAQLLPLRLFDFLAKKASRNSREKSSKYSDDETKVFFRKGAFELSHMRGVDIVVLGHSHIFDEAYESDKSYFNVGFASTSKKFFSWNGNKASLINI